MPKNSKSANKPIKFIDNITTSDITMACMICPKPFLDKSPDSWQYINDSRFQLLRNICSTRKDFKAVFEDFMKKIASYKVSMHDVWDNNIDDFGIVLTPTHNLQLEWGDLVAIREADMVSYNITIYFNNTTWWKTIGIAVGKLHKDSVPDFFPYLETVGIFFNDEGQEMFGESELEFDNIEEFFEALRA